MNNIQIYILALIAVLVIGGFAFNQRLAKTRLMAAPVEAGRWHSRPNYHGYVTAWSVALVTLVLFILGTVIQGISSIVLLLAILGSGLAVIFLFSRRINSDFRARTHTESFIKAVLISLSVVAVLTTFGIVFSLLFESLRFFSKVPFTEFLFGLQWSPQTALRADQAGSSGAFGAVPIFAGTFLIMAVAIAIAGPVGLMIAMFLSEYASKRTRAIVKPLIEILAGIPTVVYGFFALLTVGPTIRGFAESLGFAVPTQSALAAGVVMGVMIIPLISSLSDDVINAVPQTLRDGSYALGANKSSSLALCPVLSGRSCSRSRARLVRR